MGLIKLYIRLLKTHPIRTNLCTASLLMIGGDMLAQEIERYHMEDEFSFHTHDLDGVPSSRRLHLHPYGGFVNVPREKAVEGAECKESGSNGDGNSPIISDIANGILNSIQASIDRNDWVRSVTMGFWAVAFYTPAYMALYAAFDRIFPKKTAVSIGARVVGVVVYSIPVNALFFVYGTSVHHTLEWYGLWDSLLADAEEEVDWSTGDKKSVLTMLSKKIIAAAAADLTTTSSSRDPKPGHAVDASEESEEREKTRRHYFLPLPERPPPYDAEMMLSKAQLKIETELVSTVTNSAKMWIPINLFNFALVPNHLQPFGLLFFSVFWNCYLSLVQHRDVPLPQDVCTLCGLADCSAAECSG